MALRVSKITDLLYYTCTHSSGEKFVLVFKPLTVAQKAELQGNLEKSEESKNIKNYLEALKSMISLSLVEIKGLELEDGSPFVFNPMENDSIESVLNFDNEILNAITSIVVNILGGNTKTVKDVSTGSILENIEFGDNLKN